MMCENLVFLSRSVRSHCKSSCLWSGACDVWCVFKAGIVSVFFSQLAAMNPEWVLSLSSAHDVLLMVSLVLLVVLG